MVLYVYLWVIALLCRWCILALAEFVHGFGVNSNKLSNHLATYNIHCTACNSLISKMGCSASSLVSRSPHSFKVWSALIREKQLNTKECGYKSAIFFLCLSSLLVKTTMSNNDISKMVQVLTVILSRNWCLLQHGALWLFSIFIATNSPWLIKLLPA